MTLLSNDEFISQLAGLYMDARLGGPKAVSVTMKPYDGRSKAMPKQTGLQSDSIECLFRAKLGDRKISTAVCSKDVNKFHQSYVGVLRANMDNLEKRKRGEEDKKQATKA